MQLITRDDTGIVAALIVGAVLLFQQPLHGLLEAMREVEARYHLDLVPALTVLSVTLIFHHYRRRQQARAEARALAAEAAQVRARSEELQRIMKFGQELTSTLDRTALQQVLWRGLAAFANGRDYWLLTVDNDRWEPLVQDARRAALRAPDELESIAARVPAEHDVAAAQETGVAIDGHLCFAIVNAGVLGGVMGFVDTPAFSAAERRAIGAVATVIGIALTNARVLAEARESGVRDTLTGCVHRSHGLDALQNELRRSRRTGRPCSIVMFDIDHFKAINDEGGHLRGDALLASVGAMLRRVLRGSDIVCRYGGDEFLVILPDTPLPGAQRVADAIRAEITSMSVAASVRKHLTASLGVTASLPGEMDVTAIVGRADEALYRAKAEGRDRSCTAAAASVVSFDTAQRAAM